MCMWEEFIGASLTSLKWLFNSRFSPKQVVFSYKMKVFILSLLIFEMFEIQ